ILPAPVIGGVGLLDDVSIQIDLAFKRLGEAIVLLGETRGWLGSSLYVRELAPTSATYAPPPVDLAAERRRGAVARALIAEKRRAACHDVSDGGLLVALAEMALAGATGCEIEIATTGPQHATLFGEDQGRYVVASTDPVAVLAAARAAGVP